MFKGMVPLGRFQATCVSGAPPGPNRVLQGQQKQNEAQEKKEHGGWCQPMCDPEGCSTVWGAVGGGGGPTPPPKGGGGPPPPSLTQTQHLFRQAPSKRANTQS